jgi:hypothetical protein
VWSHLIEAKTHLVAYTMDPEPNGDDYVEAYKRVSKAIDEVRGVYLNVGEDGRYRGWYSYQPLHGSRCVQLFSPSSNRLSRPVR